MRLQINCCTWWAGLMMIPQLLIGASDNDSLSCNNKYCCRKDITPTGIMISHLHAKNEWMFSYKYMRMTMDGMCSGMKTTGKEQILTTYLMAPEKMRMDMHMLMAMYGITNKITTMVMFNYHVNCMDMLMPNAYGHHHPGDTSMNMGNQQVMHIMKTSGMGDIKIHLLYGLIKQANKQLITSLGASIPAGTIQLKGNTNDLMYANHRYPYAMQLGTGTFDILPAVNYLYQQPLFSFSSQLLSTIRTGYNKLGYKWGNELTFTNWFSYQWLNFLSSSIRVEGNIAGAITGNDPKLYYYNEPAANPNNYGGKKINGYIGSVLQFKKGVLKNNRLGIEYGIPFYQDLKGTQMKSSNMLQASWSISFN